MEGGGATSRSIEIYQELDEAANQHDRLTFHLASALFPPWELVLACTSFQTGNFKWKCENVSIYLQYTSDYLDLISKHSIGINDVFREDNDANSPSHMELNQGLPGSLGADVPQVFVGRMPKEHTVIWFVSDDYVKGFHMNEQADKMCLMMMRPVKRLADG